MRANAILVLALMLLLGVHHPSHAEAANMTSERELILVSAPRFDDTYYDDARADILAFHKRYAERVIPHDDFIVLTDRETYPDYVAMLGPDQVAIAPQADIWLRDFGLSNVSTPIRFRYTAAGQGGGRNGQADADYVQAGLTRLMQSWGLTYRTSDRLNDGGNWVDDYAGRVVISRKFLRDNQLSERQARRELTGLAGVEHVAFIESDEQGGLEHADGVVAFIDPNVLVINRYDEDPQYASALIRDLRAGLPGVTIHEIVTPYDGDQIYDEKFGSACGLYTNMLVTPERIYSPQFGLPEDDVARAGLAGWTQKDIIPVPSERICVMGGGVRCMSWQLRGANAVRAKAMLKRREIPE